LGKVSITSSWHYQFKDLMKCMRKWKSFKAWAFFLLPLFINPLYQMFQFSRYKILFFHNIEYISCSANMSFEVYYSSSVWRVAQAAIWCMSVHPKSMFICRMKIKYFCRYKKWSFKIHFYPNTEKRKSWKRVFVLRSDAISRKSIQMAKRGVSFLIKKEKSTRKGANCRVNKFFIANNLKL
jgi:hypothetical protein